MIIGAAMKPEIFVDTRENQITSAAKKTGPIEPLYRPQQRPGLGENARSMW